ncbi:MAG: ABC transporter ATP-binding protein [Planctomycetota bacterium]
MTEIRLEKLTKELGGNEVIAGIDLTFSGGNVIVLLGANGAGKTTLLHILGGLYQPTSGQVLLDKEPLERTNLGQRQRIHYLPDIPTLHPSQTPLDYIVFALECYGCTTEVDDQRVLDLMEEFDMLAVADNPCRALSRGQRYKATLIAMLAVDPDVWILDEPFTSGMDPLGLTAMRSYLMDAGKRGKLVVYSTQLVEIAQQTSDLVCVLSSNQVAAFGTADSLQESADNSPALNILLQQLRGDADMLAFTEEESD